MSHGCMFLSDAHFQFLLSWNSKKINIYRLLKRFIGSLRSQSFLYIGFVLEPLGTLWGTPWSPLVAPRCALLAPRWCQDATKSLSKASPKRPRSTPDYPQTTPRAPRGSPEAPRAKNSKKSIFASKGKSMSVQSTLAVRDSWGRLYCLVKSVIL